MAKRAVDVVNTSDQHVRWNGEAWIVRAPRARHPTAVCGTKEEAIEAAKRITGWPGGTAHVIVHSRSGGFSYTLSKSPADLMLAEYLRERYGPNGPGGGA